MQLIVITPDDEVREERRIVNELFMNGLQRLHLRKPLFSVADYRAYIRAIDPAFHSRVVLTGSFELMDEFALGGIHLNTAVRSDKRVWQRVGVIDSAQVSTSFHSWADIRDNEFPYRYVFISPVFDSISKKGYKAAIDLAGASVMKQELAANSKYCPRIIGLGGVGEQQIGQLYQHGFDGAAVLGAVWQSGDPVNAFVKIQAATRALFPQGD